MEKVSNHNIFITLGEILPREQFAKRKAAIAEAKKNKNANQPKVFQI